MGVLEFPYPLRFLFAPRPEVLTQVLGVVYPAISTYLVRRAGLRVGASARTGAITLIQRFGSALNPNIHLHMLAVDGVYTTPSTVPVPRRRARPKPYPRPRHRSSFTDSAHWRGTATLRFASHAHALIPSSSSFLHRSHPCRLQTAPR